MATADTLPVAPEPNAVHNVLDSPANDMRTHPPDMHDYHCFQHLHPDFAAHLQQTPHIPLPLDTPLPPSAYDFSSHGAFAGPAGHPLFEGVMAMHQMLGHDLNIDWPDIPPCDQTTYNHQQSTQVYPQWPSPSNSIIDSTPSPLDESPPHTPDRVPEYLQDGLISPDSCLPPALSQPAPSPPASVESSNSFPLVVTNTTSYEQPVVAFQTDVSSFTNVYCMPKHRRHCIALHP